MTTHEQTTHDDLPRELRGMAAQLEALGELERLAAEDAVMRTTMRTAHLLREPPARAPSAMERLRAAWLWIAAPAVAAAAVALGLMAVTTVAPPSAVPTDGTAVLAASIESDIDAWLAIDSMWSADSFETNLAAISIDAAGITTTADSLDSLSVFEAGL